MSVPLYIFDLDGTLALCGHRKHHLDAKDWRSFYAACDQDAPNGAVIATAESLYAAGADIWIFSGRSSEVRQKTEQWLWSYLSFAARMGPALLMRDEGDHRPDDELKQLWFDRMLDEDRARLVATFDDRDRVVQMWRRNGVTCFQVAPGDF